MIRTIAAVVLAVSLAACGTTQPQPGQITVAYQDTDGTVKYRSLSAPRVSPSDMVSISTYNPFTGKFRDE